MHAHAQRDPALELEPCESLLNLLSSMYALSSEDEGLLDEGDVEGATAGAAARGLVCLD